MRWWRVRRRWRRSTAAHRRRTTTAPDPYGRIPDGDTVPVPGYPTWADLLRQHLDEPTAAYRTVRVPPWVNRDGRR
jgi:hypothetical protein